MTALTQTGDALWRAASSVFAPVLLLLLLPLLARVHPPRRRLLALCTAVGLYLAAYAAALRAPDTARWLYPLESPFVPAILFVALPAALLPRHGAWRLLLVIPAVLLAATLAVIAHNMTALPSGTRFAWFLVNPGLLALGFVSFLTLASRVMRLNAFRALTRIAFFALLVYGGFAFRQNAADYQEMLARRQTATRDIMNLSETSPVLRDSRRLAYLPSAPCRFSADGGYVQGCVMEWLQRVLLLDPR